MIKIVFIGSLNQTNTIVSNIIDVSYDAGITFYEPVAFFSEVQTLVDKGLNLVIFDLNTTTGFGNAPNNIKKIKQHLPKIPLLAMHPYENKKFIKPLVEAGANGVISVTPAEEELTQAIDHLLAGRSFISYPK